MDIKNAATEVSDKSEPVGEENVISLMEQAYQKNKFELVIQQIQALGGGKRNEAIGDLFKMIDQGLSDKKNQSLFMQFADFLVKDAEKYSDLIKAIVYYRYKEAQGFRFFKTVDGKFLLVTPSHGLVLAEAKLLPMDLSERGGFFGGKKPKREKDLLEVSSYKVLTGKDKGREVNCNKDLAKKIADVKGEVAKTLAA